MMTKLEFLDELLSELSRLGALTVTDAEEYLAYYSEMIDDRIEGGMNEEEAVAALGSPRDAARAVMMEMPITDVIAAKVKRRTAWRTWEILLLALGSPIWLPLLLTFAALAITAYCVIWSAAVAVWAVDLSLAAGSLAFLVSSAVAIFGAELSSGALYLGAALLSLGLSGVTFFGCVKLTALLVRLTAMLTRLIKFLIIGKRRKG